MHGGGFNTNAPAAEGAKEQRVDGVDPHHVPARLPETGAEGGPEPGVAGPRARAPRERVKTHGHRPPPEGERGSERSGCNPAAAVVGGEGSPRLGRCQQRK